MNKKESKRFFIELFSVFFSFAILVFSINILYYKSTKPELNCYKVISSEKVDELNDPSLSISPKGSIGPEETVSSHEDNQKDFPTADVIAPLVKGSNANYLPPDNLVETTGPNTSTPYGLEETVICPSQEKINSSISIEKNTDAPLSTEDTQPPCSIRDSALNNNATKTPIIEQPSSHSSTTKEKKTIGEKTDNLPFHREVIITPYSTGDPLFELRGETPVATSLSSTTEKSKAIKTNTNALPSKREDIVTPYSTGDPPFEPRGKTPVATSPSSTTKKNEAIKTNTNALPSKREDIVTPYSTGDPPFEFKAVIPKTAEKKYSLSSTIKENNVQALPVFKVQSPISTIMVDVPSFSQKLGENTLNTPKKSLQQSKKSSVSKKKRNKPNLCKPAFDKKLYRPKVSRDCTRFISAGFIYWTVCQEGLAFAVPGFGFEAEKECIADINGGWQPGFTLGLGLDLGCCWCIDIDYTWLQSCNGNSITAQPFYIEVDDCSCGGKSGKTTLAQTSLVSYWDINNKFHPNLTLAEACLDVYFNDLQVTTGRCICINRCLTAKLLFGLQGAWIYQDYHVKYRNTLYEQANTWMSQDFKGIGPMMGFEFLWNICGKINLYADVDVATLWSYFSVNRRDKEITAEHPNQILIHNCQKICCLDPVLGMGVGLRYCNCYFSLEAGWQAQIWFDHNQYIKFSPGHTGDLILQGLKVEASIMF